jgi:hypothetical protein
MKMKLDDSLVKSAQILHEDERNYGKSFYEKAASLASIKANTNITAYTIVLCQIAVLEAKISNKTNAMDLYPELSGLYAVLSTLVPNAAEDPATERLGAIEDDVRAMAEKLAPMPRAESMRIDSPE